MKANKEYNKDLVFKFISKEIEIDNALLKNINKKYKLIDELEESIKEVVFLTVGCVNPKDKVWKKYSPSNELNPKKLFLKNILDKVIRLYADKNGYEANIFSVWNEYNVIKNIEKEGKINEIEINYNFILDKIYRVYFMQLVNKYMVEFGSKPYYLLEVIKGNDYNSKIYFREDAYISFNDYYLTIAINKDLPKSKFEFFMCLTSLFLIVTIPFVLSFIFYYFYIWIKYLNMIKKDNLNG